MRRIKLFSLIEERVARRMCPSRWSARRRTSWSASGGSPAAESLETRCLLAAGDLDPSFGVGGMVTTSFVIGAEGTSMVIQNDGKIIVAGVTNNDFSLARYNSDGSLDTSFGGDGTQTTDFSAGVDSANSVALQADGKIVVAGLSNGDFALARYNGDGSLDASFDGDGTLTTSFSSGIDFANSVALQADGKIVVAGISDQNTASTRFALARYNSDGSLDTAFDGDGTLTTDFGVGFIGQGYELNLQTDGKIIVAGRSFFTSGGPNFAVVRYNFDGSLDTSFDGDGKQTTDFAAREDFANAVAVQADGRIVVAGYTVGASRDFALARYNSNGSLDTSFDGDGKLTTDFITGDEYGYDVVLQNDGKIVVIGSSNLAFALARYNTDGSLDTSFNDDGLLLTVFGSSPRGEAKNAALQLDGKIVVAGYSGGYFALARYIADGSPTITSASSVNVAENLTAVLTVSGTDPEHGALTYSLAGGADDSLFSLNLTTGALAFLVAPNFESPQDADHNNVYDVRVSVSDGTNPVTQDIHVTVTNVDEMPSITSANAASVLENTTSIQTVTASDPEGHFLLYGITGGADQSKFTLNFLTGTLSFISPPNFEHPTDANHDNVYEVQVAVSDGTHLYTQDISVTVTNVNETVTIPLPANGGNFKTLFLNGQLHLRSSLGKPLIAPVTLSGGADVQFNGSNAADRLTLDRSWSRFIGSLTFDGNGGNDQFDARAVSLGVALNGGDGNDTFLGGRGDDTTSGGAGLDSLSGNDGNDSLAGGEGNDKLFGGADGDILIGDAGTDSLSGGDDDDSLSGGDANDTLFGDAGNDTITGDAGVDSINGGNDDDVLLGNAGNDAIDGGTGDDVIDGGDDNDNLKGSDGNDAIRGGIGNDTLSGGKGDDLLTGSAGNDSLNGDDGTDTLLGDDGNDKLNGGLGTDIINGVTTGPSKDTIGDTTKIIDTSFVFDFDALLVGLVGV